MTKVILALGVGVLTAGAAYFLASAIHRRVGNQFGPMLQRMSPSAPSEGGVPAKQERLNKLSVRMSKWSNVFYAVVLGLLAGLAVWRSA